MLFQQADKRQSNVALYLTDKKLLDYKIGVERPMLNDFKFQVLQLEYLSYSGKAREGPFSSFKIDNNSTLKPYPVKAVMDCFLTSGVWIGIDPYTLR